ncbi:MAG: ATP-binding cassette domain-containing protein [Methanomassiliicoccales archaeon]|nr:MAG: ATP-binding cassette domain-containing protein [Methanomassiliicoccales archaeon]
MSQENIIEINDLYISFYTRSGIVKAIDGVNLTIKKGETLGLVGETGCGKSVTANSIMRLIPQPPGKIENGSIYFLPPKGDQAEIEELEEKIDSIKKIILSGDYKDLENLNSELKRLEENLQRSKEINACKVQLEEYKKQPRNEEINNKIKKIEKKIEKLLEEYDLLKRSKGYMQQIRGKYISMIFQEPMSALNPVMTAGDQIMEVLLLHDRKQLAIGAINRLEKELDIYVSKKKVTKSKNSKGEYECDRCKAIVIEGQDYCPGCGNYFEVKPFKIVRKNYLKYQLTILRRIKNRSNSRILSFFSKRELRREALDRAERMLRLVRIPDPETVAKSYPHELSGGMQQRVMIAIALACKPQLLIADEPTTALDVTIQAQILKLMKDLQEETGTAILLITHNLGVVAEICDRVGVMYAGTMAEIGPKMSVFKEPFHPYTQGLINSIPKVTSDIGRLETIEGNVPNLMKPPSGCRFNPRCPYSMEICSKEKPSLEEIQPGHFVACHLYRKVRI